MEKDWDSDMDQELSQWGDVAGEAARELLSTSPAPGSPTEDKLAAPAAAAPAGAAEEVEESLEPLAPEVEKAPGSRARSDEGPLAGTQSPVPAPRSPPGCSQALLDLARCISFEVAFRAWLEVQASGQQPEKPEGDLELSHWDECTEEELSHGDAESYQGVSDWEEDGEHELPHGDVSSSQELSDWEESIGHELCQKEDSAGQEVSRENEKRPSMQSSWGSDSDQGLVLDSWEQCIGAKPLLQEDDEWDEIGVIKLCEDTDREQRLADLTRSGFFVPAPREAWVEHGTSEPCLLGPLCASPPHAKAPAPRGHRASPAFQEQVPEASTWNLLSALRSRPSPSGAQPGAQALSQQRHPHKKRPSRLRRALRALRSLFRWPCLAPQPKD